MKICIIAGCSLKKLEYSAKAIDMNQGQLFRSIRKLAARNHFDMKILSGKYGLLDANEVIDPYNQKIRTQKDILNVRSHAIPKLISIWEKYDLIIVIMGNNYRKVVEPLFDNKFLIVYDRRGIGGYLSLISKYNKLSTAKLLKELEQFRCINHTPTLKEKVKLLEGI